MADRPKLYFVFPYRGVGGVSLLFLRLAEELARTGQADCVLVDYADGFMAQHRAPNLTALAVYTDHGAVEIPGDAVAIFQSMTPWSIYPGLKPAPETRVLFWNCHPYNLVPTPPGARSIVQSSRLLTSFVVATILRPFRNRLRRFAALLLSTDSLVFMDCENLETTSRFLNLKIDAPRFLPIGAPSASARRQNSDTVTTDLRCAWIGRLVDFKYPILERTIRELDRVATEQRLPLMMTVVGTGAYIHQLKSLAAQVAMPLELIDHLSPDQVDTFLSDQVDLLLAMGTSALEGAKIGLPTILLDFSYKTVPDTYKFRWLADRDGMTLADFISDRHCLDGKRSLDQLLAELTNDRTSISHRTHDYFLNNHALPGVASKLMLAVKAARCRWENLDAANLLRPGPVYGLFRRLKRHFARSAIQGDISGAR